MNFEREQESFFIITLKFVFQIKRLRFEQMQNIESK